MLRLYKPITHDIFKLQDMLEHLLCSVWCEADIEQSCVDKLNPDFKVLYLAYDWLKNDVDSIYEDFCGLSPFQKIQVKKAFITTNSIEKLCAGEIRPISLHTLPSFIETKVKPLLVDFYEILLERAKVPGTKKDYYGKLITGNEYKYCPGCGMTDIEQEDSKNREAFDHYLPKAQYPFASINFGNLVPLCYKCNSDRKGEKDPIENGRKAFYPFNDNPHDISITITIDKTKDLRILTEDDIQIGLSLADNEEQIETWDALFDISERYNSMVRSFIVSQLRKIKRRHNDFAEGKLVWSYTDSLNKLIEDYKYDNFDDKKFLKISLMQELKNCSDLVDVYGS